MKTRGTLIVVLGIMLLAGVAQVQAESGSAVALDDQIAFPGGIELLHCATPSGAVPVEEPVVQEPVEPVQIDGPCHCPVGRGETIQDECPSPVVGSCGDYTCNVCTAEDECATRNCFSL